MDYLPNWQIGTVMTLTNIRKNPDVHEALQRTAGNIVYYPWSEDVRDVVPIGFFIGPLPKIQNT
jgi:phage pi2 protein 07